MFNVREERSASYLPKDLYGVPAYSSFLLRSRRTTCTGDLCAQLTVDHHRKLNGDDLGRVLASPGASSDFQSRARRRSLGPCSYNATHSSSTSRITESPSLEGARHSRSSSSSSRRITEPASLEDARHRHSSGLRDSCYDGTDDHPVIAVVVRSAEFVGRVFAPLCARSGFSGRDIGRRGAKMHSVNSLLADNLCSCSYPRNMQHTVGTKDSYSWLTACALGRSNGTTGERCSSSTGIGSRCSSGSLHGVGFSGLSRCSSVDKHSYDVVTSKTSRPNSSELEVAPLMRQYPCKHRSDSARLGIRGEDLNAASNKDASLDQSHSFSCICGSRASSLSPSLIQSEESAEPASTASVSYYDPRLWCKSELGGSGYGQLADNGTPSNADNSSACSSPATFSNPRCFTAEKHWEQTPRTCTSESDLSGLVMKLEEVLDSACVGTDDAKLQVARQPEQVEVGFLPERWGDSIAEEDPSMILDELKEDANISWDELHGILQERDEMVGDLVVSQTPRRSSSRPDRSSPNLTFASEGVGLDSSFLSP